MGGELDPGLTKAEKSAIALCPNCGTEISGPFLRYLQ
jgi:hypothetical protein